MLAAALLLISVPGLQRPVEILRDRWGVPHIYAENQHDLFLAQGYITAKDRLFQIDLWRRAGTGKLAEVLGPQAVERDRLARSVRYRGSMAVEWESYGPGTRAIVTAFTNGINAYIRSLEGKWPVEFRVAGYPPGLWQPEDCLSRIAGLLMTRNLTREVARAMDARRFGMPALGKYLRPDPPVSLELPHGLELSDITPDILRAHNEAIGPVRFRAEAGSNNWVVDGTMTMTGKPILANDPHRAMQIPSLRKTVHLVAPGWNAIGAGEPAIPGIALGHNERIAFGFTIVGIDQQDLYVEKLNPANRNEYRYRGAWKKMEIERQTVAVKDRAPVPVELRHTIHGPVIYEDDTRHRAYVLRWVGTEAGTAGYLAGLAISRARNWTEFQAAVQRYRVPSENIVYADVDGNIGWQAAGLTPVRPNWTGLYPVPGDTGEYEWKGFRRISELPHAYNPPAHYIATANHNILPADYKIPLGYEWALPFRFERIREMLEAGRKFGVQDFARMQMDVTSVAARRFQAVLKRWNPRPAAAEEVLRWDGAITAESVAAAIYEAWFAALPEAMFGRDLGSRVDARTVLETLEHAPNPGALAHSLDDALTYLTGRLGRDRREWKWGRLHQIEFRHPLNQPQWHRGPIPRPGDAGTVNATGGPALRQTSGASYREIIDLSNWDNSIMTNVPGESGDPESRHYADLINDWAAGRYHPMPFSRKAVEAATEEKIRLEPPTKR